MNGGRARSRPDGGVDDLRAWVSAQQLGQHRPGTRKRLEAHESSLRPTLTGHERELAAVRADVEDRAYICRKRVAVMLGGCRDSEAHRLAVGRCRNDRPQLARARK